MTTLFYPIITKQKRISPHIEKFEFNLGVMVVSCWVVTNGHNHYLVDSGMGDMAKYLLQKYFTNQKFAAIFLTHGHSDHIGGIAAIKNIFPDIPIVIDDLEIPFVTGEQPYPQRKKIEKNIFPAQFFSSLKGEVSEKLQREAGLESIFTPGHSPGHNCFYHQADQVLIAGDLFTTNRQELAPPMKQYTADMDAALKSGMEVLKNFPNSVISVCHGTEVKNVYYENAHLPWLQN